MSLELDKNIDLSLAKTVRLGNTDFQVPPLKLREILAAVEMQGKAGASDTTLASIDHLIDFVLLGLKRPYPKIEKNDLLDMEITIAQLKDAADVVMLQAGAKKADPAGEAKAASDLNLPIGASSSPTSALN